MTDTENNNKFEAAISNDEVVQKYLDRFRHSKQSQNSRKYALKYFFNVQYFGYSKSVFKMTKRDVIDYFHYLNQAESLSLQTKQNKWAIFRSFIQFVMEYYDDFVVVLPRYCTQWKPNHKEPDSNKDVVMTIDEVKKILDHNFNYNYNYYVLLRLLAETGMRVGELIGLDCNDVNLKKRYVEARGKTGHKVYYFSKGFARHLGIYLNERLQKQTETNALFLSTRRKRFAVWTINHYIQECIARVNINKRISSHTNRRTLNTLRFREGCPKEERRILLCHKVSDVNFNCYVKLNYDDYVKLFDQWNPYKDALASVWDEP